MNPSQNTNARRRSTSINTGAAALAVDTSPNARRHSIHVESPTAAGVKYVTGFPSAGRTGQGAAPKVVGPGIVVLAAPPSMALDPAAAFLPWQEDDVVQAAMRGERHWGLYVHHRSVVWLLRVGHAADLRRMRCLAAAAWVRVMGQVPSGPERPCGRGERRSLQ